MAGYIASIILASALFLIAFMRWRGSSLFWPLIVLTSTLVGWSLFKIVDGYHTVNFWNAEWSRQFGIFCSLYIFLRNFRQHADSKTLLLQLATLAVFVIWLLTLIHPTGELEPLIQPSLAGLVLLLMLQQVERAGNQFPETFRAEIAPLSGAFSVLLIWELLSMLVLMLSNNDQPQSLDVSRGLISTLAMAFGVIHIQRIDKDSLQLPEVQQSYRPTSSLNIFAIFSWLSAVGYILIDFLTQNHQFSLSFIITALIGFFILAYNKKLYGQIKILITKLFSSYKYDYRKSWLGFNRALDEANVQGDFYQLSIKALANMINSGSGKLWSSRGERFSFTDHWQSPLEQENIIQLPSSLVAFIDKNNWVVDLNEYQQNPDLYQGLQLSLQANNFSNSKIFVPLRRGEELVAIVGLGKSFTKQSLNWEDHDLLKAAGQQVASYLALYEATSQIYEQEQFNAFNRLSTFVVHDLKNVTAQLELITHNAHKYRNNDAFIDDAFETVDSATNRLNKMLAQLKRKQQSSKDIKQASISAVFEQFVANSEKLTLKGDIPLVTVYADGEQLLNIVQHLHQNALEASAAEQLVEHQLELIDNELHWNIIDQGKGMDQDFIRKQLFKPFATTKGNAGMGIGVYQCRYLLQSFGGDLIIQSELGKGTRCIVILQMLNEH
ncbi:MAG: PEP-CTERM system histidine kinase PrsK [Kangiellaceae bacterium]|nr:PEP-CTERM system histidine kinase PrsK [Kangiellaceae bacterium]